jgi:hypothetical protein
LTILHTKEGDAPGRYDSSLVFDGDETTNQLIMFLGVIEGVKYDVLKFLEGRRMRMTNST